tara:strand:- start:606 stop:812 length:207 start_codon:yes stop_codon:yes gene_type:complete
LLQEEQVEEMETSLKAVVGEVQVVIEQPLVFLSQHVARLLQWVVVEQLSLPLALNHKVTMELIQYSVQ